jgi:hypothetical protein
MKRILVFAMVLCMILLLCAGAQEQGIDPLGDKMNDNKPGKVTTPIPPPVPVAKPVTQLTVKIIDDMNDKVVELNNCIVQIVGELHICEDSFKYQNSFTEGDKYEMVIWVKLKK